MIEGDLARRPVVWLSDVQLSNAAISRVLGPLPCKGASLCCAFSARREISGDAYLGGHTDPSSVGITTIAAGPPDRA